MMADTLEWTLRSGRRRRVEIPKQGTKPVAFVKVLGIFRDLEVEKAKQALSERQWTSEEFLSPKMWPAEFEKPPPLSDAKRQCIRDAERVSPPPRPPLPTLIAKEWSDRVDAFFDLIHKPNQVSVALVLRWNRVNVHWDYRFFFRENLDCDAKATLLEGTAAAIRSTLWFN
uniref:Uncharacterized protein n=1 Tax=Chromera velia CCMP2878 TaxID=1169474 RepID=A0A0G4HGM0_9ALVE|eukprot:Cvel_27378.t1-p1 / transcript=Cvel_27378.t1 / gene=Cvel_27378 / organism=Chromera_velia_CCMP2878 / gene_product=hypothetical protein / transcript_product=hypothetical protein / location=Cvel_scaffold3406:14703-15212(-) / protein_length=170 / sequence_SO=supercontig / SO=protein_coding / is_pseudo=false